MSVAAAAALALAGCSTSSASTTSSTTSTATGITTAWPADLTSLDPMNLSNSEDTEVANNVYEGLVAYDFKKTSDGSEVWQGSKVAPALAKSWTIDKNAITFDLDPNRKFYPSGNPVTASDVKWSLEAALHSLNAQDITTNGLQSGDDIHVVDAHTVTIDFTDTSGNPIDVGTTQLAMFVNTNERIIDSVAAKKHATASDPYASKWLRSNVVGSGPYYLSSWSKGQQVVLKANPDYPDQPAYKTVTARIVNNANVASLVKSGSINFAEFDMSETDVTNLQKAGFTVASQATPTLTYLTMAADTGAFTNEKVRQAVADAIPYKQIVSTVYSGRAERAYSIVNSSSSSYTPAWNEYSTDLTKAKQLMKQAGNPTIYVPLHYDTSDPAQENIALLIQENLKTIGITVKLTPETDDQQWDIINGRSRNPSNPGSADMVLFNWGPWTDDPKIPVGYAATKDGVNNYALWSNPTVDTLNATWQLKAPSSARDAAYKQAQKIIADAAPVIPITYADRQSVMAKGITGASFEQFASTRYYLLTPTK
ncbi:peptide/nickel transport system substrate-binding protein [Frondihabitans australicus]|uniref:Peptide/nickel transport system substrate-binding protein n=2 Tax=Frondihabitans australicus TaxID=386892 RepID=A0A495IL75_9MICO|nr:peptide/nickel transport system substrate-binding protein [Frondihabitans australicus]